MAKAKKNEPAPVTLTPRAIEQFKKAVVREQAPEESGLRIMLVDAGNGFRYDMMFETKPKPTDHITEQGGVRVIIEQTAVPYLFDTTLDFIDNDYGGGFIFHRPQED